MAVAEGRTFNRPRAPDRSLPFREAEYLHESESELFEKLFCQLALIYQRAIGAQELIILFRAYG